MSIANAQLKEEKDVKILRGNSNRYQVRLCAVALLAVLGLVVAGGSSASPAKSAVAGAQRTTSSTVVKARKIKGLGVVLVNAKGRTLYTFAPDRRRHVTCTALCARYWPPLKLKGSKATAASPVKAKLLGSDPSPAGGKVVTYSKWPLYTYAGDSAAGQANGQNLSNEGGKWYVITPGGKVIKHSA